MQRLIDAGHAYAADGDVYFDVRSFPRVRRAVGPAPGRHAGRGRLAADTGKRDPRDFALWKSAKAGEPSWPTPWGPGRPGWHLECSAMAGKYLGAAFDIHGGGLDLIFPHHENEIAQSQAAGDAFAQYWLHNAWVTTSGEKMSKSLATRCWCSEVVQRVRPIELRYYLVSAHYRSMIEFSDRGAGGGRRRLPALEGFLRAGRAHGMVAATSPASRCAPSFDAAMDDDLGVPQALAASSTTPCARATRRSPPATSTAVRGLAARCVAMLDVLGVDPLAAPWSDRGASDDERLRAAVDRSSWPALRAARSRPAQRQGLGRGRRHPGPAERRRHRRRRHPRRPTLVAAREGGLMAGNSQRKGAMRKPGSKKGADRRVRRPESRG